MRKAEFVTMNLGIYLCCQVLKVASGFLWLTVKSERKEIN